MIDREGLEEENCVCSGCGVLPGTLRCCDCGPLPPMFCVDCVKSSHEHDYLHQIEVCFAHSVFICTSVYHLIFDLSDGMGCSSNGRRSRHSVIASSSAILAGHHA